MEPPEDLTSQATIQSIDAVPSAPVPPAESSVNLQRRQMWWIKLRARRFGVMAGIIAMLLVALLLSYLIPRFRGQTAKSGIASIDLPASELSKLSSNSISVATDRTLSFNTPVIFQGDIDTKGNATINNLKVTGQLILPTQQSNGSSQTLAQSINVLGTSLLQGDVTAKTNLAVGGNLNVAGNGSFAGNLSGNQLNVKSSVLGNATIGHLITSGASPTAKLNNAAGAGTVSITGNDTAGTITITTGSGALGQGDLITVTFKTAFTSTPHVVITPVGLETAVALSDVGGIFYVSRSTTLFTVGASKMKLGVAGVSYSFDYFVTQ